MIYDGLGVAPLLNWSQHFVNALETCQLVRGRATQSIIGDPPVLGQHPRTRNKSTEVVGYSITLDNQEWRFERGSFVAQTDGYNCGPIACLKILEIYSLVSLEQVKLAYSINSMRKLVIDNWKRFLNYCNSDLVVTRRQLITLEEPHPAPGMPLLPIRPIYEQMQEPVNPAVVAAAVASAKAPTADMDVCICCANDPLMELIEMKCCKKTIHRQCVIAWLAMSNRCVHCQQAVTMEVVEYPAILCTESAVPESPYLPAKNLFEIKSPSPIKKRIGRLGGKRTINNDLKAAAVEEMPLRATDRNRQDSMKKKRELQKKDHDRMIKARGDSVNAL
jgi:hypothetical protein